MAAAPLVQQHRAQAPELSAERCGVSLKREHTPIFHTKGAWIMAVKPIPEGYHSVTPYLIVRGAAQALEFYQKAFGARELFRFPMPDGQIAHAEMKIGDSHIMLADEPQDPVHQQMGHKAPKSL